MNFLERVTESAYEVVNNCGCEIVDVEYVKEGSQRILRFYVEKLSGNISLDDCVEVNNALGEMIDSLENLPEEPFVLEVSSPGVNRILKKEKDFIRFQGESVDVSVYQAIEGVKKFTVKLAGYSEGIFTFENDGRSFEVQKENIAKINLHFDFGF